MRRLSSIAALGLIAALVSPLSAQEPAPDTPEAAADTPPQGMEIIVEGIREKEEQVQAMTRQITRRARVDKPVSKFYSQVCIGVIGMTPDYARTLIARMEENARSVDLPVGGEGCQPNILIAFVKDGEQELDELRKAEPKLFATLLDYEYDRIKRGNGAVRAWHGTQLKGKDGRDFTDSGMGDAPLNNQYSSSRLSKQVRVDMTGAIVIIDSARVPGKTLQQLADYASMRAFVSIDDTSTGGASGIPTILSLFEEGTDAPDGMTTFDRAYLETVYRLPATANDSQIHDATWTMYRKLEGLPDIDGDDD